MTDKPSQTTPTGGKMPFDSQEEYEAACKTVEGKPMTPYQTQTTNWFGLSRLTSPEVLKEQQELNRLLRDSVEQVKGMTPLELENMYAAQRASWARQDND